MHQGATLLSTSWGPNAATLVAFQTEGAEERRFLKLLMSAPFSSVRHGGLNKQVRSARKPWERMTSQQGNVDWFRQSLLEY